MSIWTRIFGHKQYLRFVLICHPRTGSNLLSSYLKSHPNIKMHGEIFSKLNGKSINSIYKIFNKNKERKFKASGFKVFYSHPDDGDNEELLNLIENIPNLVVIHLTRKNKIRTLVSWRIALLTNIWGKKRGETLVPTDQKRLNIIPGEAVSFISDLNHKENYIDQRFNKYKYIHITYEDLVDDPQQCVNKIFPLLIVPDHEVKTNYIKSNPEPLNELIENFKELKDKKELAQWVE